MATAQIVKSKKGQAVQLPDEFRFQGEEVEIYRRVDEVVMREKSRGLERAFWLLANLPIDVDAVEELGKEPPQEREGL